MKNHPSEEDWQQKLDNHGCIALALWEEDPSSKPDKISILIRNKPLTDEDRKLIDDIGVNFREVVSSISRADIPTDKLKEFAELDCIIQIEWPKQLYLH